MTSQVVAPGVSLESVNFSYQIDGDAPFKPAGVMDDGKIHIHPHASTATGAASTLLAYSG
ncbi:hypothetical protein ACFS07_32805 [Undibacterium arcticum]